MKKILLTLALFSGAFSVYAQTNEVESIDEDILKPNKRSFSTELNVNPFNGDLKLNNAINQIKVRYFAQENLALRLGVTANATGDLVDYNNPYGTNSSFYKNERSSTTLGLNFGIEKHFKGTRRLSPYIGADLSLVNKSTKQTITNNGTTITRKGAWVSYYYPDNGSAQQQMTETGYTRYGLNLLAGFDFYIARHFYFGYEFNFGFNKTKNQQLEETQTGTGATNPQFKPETNSSYYSFGSNLQNGIRLGFIF
ncbi:hypothetical protein [Solitalea canadensis]|uniref:Outer membrane protein beta-barrel domain-containing protein n=1 Tax=Solitalea canadensis (strain ATCC 29591 / DSM 3403 / JCM 21819 / LMG 8368 / NBRC 15130 / NCIMB 12057 / USAM 9D) TaxID=929556 RepID=H8KT31_SOLCM|nr:hypothetical protein [Solitalea canadensis]AFD05602.1 hypothetical protein Solca_0470 [Solitalea canadensis DSM 3403]